MSLLVGKHRVDKCCDEAGVSVVAPVTEAEEGWEEAGDDEDGEQDDQGRGEGRCWHTDIALEMDTRSERIRAYCGEGKHSFKCVGHKSEGKMVFVLCLVGTAPTCSSWRDWATGG